MNEKKARELRLLEWVDVDTKKSHIIHCEHDPNRPDILHVIEYAALQASQDEVKELKAERDSLREALTGYVKFFDETVHWVAPVNRDKLNALKAVSRAALKGKE